MAISIFYAIVISPMDGCIGVLESPSLLLLYLALA